MIPRGLILFGFTSGCIGSEWLKIKGNEEKKNTKRFMAIVLPSTACEERTNKGDDEMPLLGIRVYFLRQFLIQLEESHQSKTLKTKSSIGQANGGQISG